MSAIRFIPLLACAVLLNACAGFAGFRGQNDAMAAFEKDFVPALMAFYPEYAIYAGDYSHAAQMTVPNATHRRAELEFVEAWSRRLARINPEALSPALRADYALIQNQLDSTRWSQIELRAWRWDPSDYNIAGPFALLLNTDYAPLDDRLRTVLARLQAVPAYFDAARANIVVPTLPHTRLAIEQNLGALGVFGPALEDQVQNSGLSDDDKRLFGERLRATRAAINGYVEWLRGVQATLTPERAHDWRLGGDLYEQKFAYQIQSGFSARELYERALAAKDERLTQMARIADELWPKYFPKTAKPADRLALIGKLIAELSKKHVAREDFVIEIKRQVPLLAEYVRVHDLVAQDPSKPLVVRETPEYQRGVAGASIDAPGPFNPGADTYYNVTPLDDMTPEQAESYLREYNHWVLQVLNMHEAIPGHYTQLLHANQSPSLIKSLLGNGAMIEGWAVYAERMMLENGYAADEQPEMWLMYGKWNLRVICNTILDYGVHVLGMSEDEALHLLTHEAFQTEAEARGKWRRVSLSSVQLTSYFAGFEEIYAFREQQKAALGADFDLKTFHERFLSYGSAPVKVIKALMKDSANTAAPAADDAPAPATPGGMVRN